MNTFLGETVSTLTYTLDNVKDEVKDIKEKCLSNPKKYIFGSATKKYPQLKEIFYHIKSLEYEDKPKYSFIQEKLKEILYIYNSNN